MPRASPLAFFFFLVHEWQEQAGAELLCMQLAQRSNAGYARGAPIQQLWELNTLIFYSFCEVYKVILTLVNSPFYCLSCICLAPWISPTYEGKDEWRKNNMLHANLSGLANLKNAPRCWNTLMLEKKEVLVNFWIKMTPVVIFRKQLDRHLLWLLCVWSSWLQAEQVKQCPANR